MKIERYCKNDKEQWNLFLRYAKNRHFFFQRDYMEYHADRFHDFSLLYFDEKGNLIALLPANLQDNCLISHAGLTFGGFLICENMTTECMLNIFQHTLAYLHENHLMRWQYKCMPYIYHQYPCEEDRYALFRNDAHLTRRDVSVAVYLPNRYKYQQRRTRAIKKARKNGLVVTQSNAYGKYWKVLSETLQVKHNSLPTHTEKEICLLANLFPNHIKLFTAQLENEIVAGAVVFENDDVVHAQYLASSAQGHELGALDAVIDYLITDVYQDKKYFDFGISNEQQGRFLNTGLIAQKEGFGARAIVHDFYEMKV